MPETKLNHSFNCSTTNKRVNVKGKFLYCNNEKFYVKGVTYGTFHPRENYIQFPDASAVEKDFGLMAKYGMNCVRTYTVPPLYLLDIALQFGLKVMVGLPWEQHITFLDSKERKAGIINRVKESVLCCSQHPSILCYTVGNEIPSSIVRWHGKKKMEGFIRQLYKAVKEVDPQSLVTYVNYPTTEYLDLSFLDFYCFNVYLETQEKLSTYVSRLHNLTGDKPLVLAEIGLDSRRNGEQKQAQTLKWQIETVFAKGCAGMFVFAWTDEWWRGGFDIEDWDFGLMDRQRNPKPALYAVSDAMKGVPFSIEKGLPFISVIVCSYNGTATIRDTLEGLQKLEYPDYEVIVVNDGSKDSLPEIVREYPVKLINTPNCGLSCARNTGWQNAKGEIIAYIDDDAYPDPHWLHYLAYAFLHSAHSGIGGPNIAPDNDGPIAICVANAPGGPMHVLISDEVAEHIPGCNMSFKRKVLEEIGGFDPIYRTAGDDVDICWRIQDAGHTIGFHPSALVWHHRRNSLKAYWKQQKGYGKAEALLEAKWPEKYNGFGHLEWAGRIYGNGLTLPIKIKRDRVFHGTWGSALFQSIYQPARGFLSAFPLMPEWYMLITFLAFTALLGLLWTPLIWIWLLFIAAVSIVIIQAVISASKNILQTPATKKNIKYKLLIAILHLIQPIARLYGRLNHGLTPWRKRSEGSGFKTFFGFRTQILTHWSEDWHPSESWLADIEKGLKGLKTRVRRGNDFDVWDLQARNGLFAKTRALLAIEEHGGGNQYLKLKVWHTISKSGIISFSILLVLSALAAMNGAIMVALIFSCFSLIVLAEYYENSCSAFYKFEKVISSLRAANPGTAPFQVTNEKKITMTFYTQPHSYSEWKFHNKSNKVLLGNALQERIPGS